MNFVCYISMFFFSRTRLHFYDQKLMKVDDDGFLHSARSAYRERENYCPPFAAWFFNIFIVDVADLVASLCIFFIRV